METPEGAAYYRGFEDGEASNSETVSARDYLLEEARRDIQDLSTEIRQANELMAQQVRDLQQCDREIEVLTQERDSALLRIEELERLLEDADPNDRLRPSWAADALRGGVNPNA